MNGREPPPRDLVGALGVGPEYFSSIHAERPDPWDADAWERRRLRATVAALLPAQRYRRAVEPGCANGALSEVLAGRCDEVFAFDYVDEAVAAARRRLAPHRHVHVVHAVFPTYWPAGTGDLVVWSNVIDYLTELGRARAIDGLQQWLSGGGHLVVVTDGGVVRPALDTGDVIAAIDETGWLEVIATHQEDAFRAAVWRRV